MFKYDSKTNLIKTSITYKLVIGVFLFVGTIGYIKNKLYFCNVYILKQKKN